MFEGLKAYRRIDGSIQLFRPKENALRMKMGAERLCMPSPTVDQFIESVKQTVLANKRWVYLTTFVTSVHVGIVGFECRLMD